MKKIIGFIIIVWLGFEVVNYFNFLSVGSSWDDARPKGPMMMPRPIYHPIVTQVFYKVFPPSIPGPTY
ncbi:MAG: hypothetical protein AAB497_03940 [Patescibacteria group bacterium]